MYACASARVFTQEHTKPQVCRELRACAWVGERLRACIRVCSARRRGKAGSGKHWREGRRLRRGKWSECSARWESVRSSTRPGDSVAKSKAVAAEEAGREGGKPQQTRGSGVGGNRGNYGRGMNLHKEVWRQAAKRPFWQTARLGIPPGHAAVSTGKGGFERVATATRIAQGCEKARERGWASGGAAEGKRGRA
eukprot:6198776-Pleurochrysis_carterae.AAC.1